MIVKQITSVQNHYLNPAKCRRRNDNHLGLNPVYLGILVVIDYSSCSSVVLPPSTVKSAFRVICRSISPSAIRLSEYFPKLGAFLGGAYALEISSSYLTKNKLVFPLQYLGCGKKCV